MSRLTKSEANVQQIYYVKTVRSDRTYRAVDTALFIIATPCSYAIDCRRTCHAEPSHYVAAVTRAEPFEFNDMTNSYIDLNYSRSTAQDQAEINVHYAYNVLTSCGARHNKPRPLLSPSV